MKPHPCNPDSDVMHDLPTASEATFHLFGALALAGGALAGGATAATVIRTHGVLKDCIWCL